MAGAFARNELKCDLNGPAADAGSGRHGLPIFFRASTAALFWWTGEPDPSAAPFGHEAFERGFWKGQPGSGAAAQSTLWSGARHLRLVQDGGLVREAGPWSSTSEPADGLRLEVPASG